MRALSYHFLCSSFLVFPPASSASSVLLSDVHSDRGPVTVTFRCLSLASFCRFLLAYCLFVWLRRLWVHAVFKYMAKFSLNCAKAPSSHRGAEGRWRCLRLLVAFSGGLQQTLSLGPCAATVTTVVECRRRHSLRRHKGGRWTVRLTSCHHVSQGGFSSVWCILRRSGQSPSAGARGLRWLQWPRVRARGAL